MNKYGNRNIAGMLKQWNELREAVKTGQREVIEDKFSACEEWIDFAFAPIDTDASESAALREKIGLAAAELSGWRETPNEGDPMIDVLLASIRIALGELEK